MKQWFTGLLCRKEREPGPPTNACDHPRLLSSLQVKILSGNWEPWKFTLTTPLPCPCWCLEPLIQSSEHDGFEVFLSLPSSQWMPSWSINLVLLQTLRFWILVLWSLKHTNRSQVPTSHNTISGVKTEHLGPLYWYLCKKKKVWISNYHKLLNTITRAYKQWPGYYGDYTVWETFHKNWEKT